MQINCNPDLENDAGLTMELEAYENAAGGGNGGCTVNDEELVAATPEREDSDNAQLSRFTSSSFGIRSG